MTDTDSASPRPGVVSVAFYITLALGILALIAIPWNPEGLIQALLFLIAAWGIRRGRAWSAYGLALLTLVLSGVPIVAALLRGQSLASREAWSLGVAAVFSLALVLLLFFAGQALERLHGRRGMAWPWIGGAVLVGGFFLLFGLYQMPTGSMEKTLLVGDRIAVWKTHGGVPARGELVVHIYPVNRKDTFVKRVVAIPGDRVRIGNKQLFINGSAVSEPYVEHVTEYVDSYRDNFPSDPSVALYPQAKEMLAKNVVNGEVVVPPGRYFVLGDNRDQSLDSRYYGFIDQSDIIGIPKFVYYSVKVDAKSKLPILAVRWQRIFRPVA